MNESPDQPPPPSDPVEAPPRYLEIDAARQGRWRGLIAYLLFFLAVAGLLLIVFVRFSGSLALGLVLVLFMIGYMLIAGKLAEGKLDRRD